MDNLPVQLQSKVLQYITDLPDFQNCRLVSKKWKHTLLDACRNKFHVVFPLTDSTLYVAHELTDALVSFDVYSLIGTEIKNAWSKSGIEALLQTTEWLQFTGTQVCSTEVKKLLGLAHNSLKTLSFKCLNVDILRPLVKTTEPFSALRKLCIGYYCSEKDNDNFSRFTDSLESLTTHDCSVKLPLLECLHLHFNGRSGNANINYYYNVLIHDLFRNYVAIVKLLLKHKQTLKELQIERVFGRYVSSFVPQLYQPEWTDKQRGFEALEELSLNSLKLLNSNVYGDEQPIEIDMTGRPKNLKNVLFQNLLYSYDHWKILLATLSSVNNVDARYLTSFKIKLTMLPTQMMNNSTDPTLAINLGALKECRNLRTLWLVINYSTNDQRRRVLVRNVELLPTEISDLRFEHTNIRRYIMGTHEILLNQQQIRWIIDNLRGLRSFSMSLVIPEQINPNANNEQVEVAGEENNDDNFQAQWQEDANRLTNFNVETFRELIAMPHIKNIRVDMMKARALAAIATENWLAQMHRLQVGVGAGTTLLDDVREYSNLCDAAGYATTTTTSNHLGRSVYEYATLTMEKNQN